MREKGTGVGGLVAAKLVWLLCRRCCSSVISQIWGRQQMAGIARVSAAEDGLRKQGREGGRGGRGIVARARRLAEPLQLCLCSSRHRREQAEMGGREGVGVSVNLEVR